MEVYHELIAEWKAEKLDVTSLFALFAKVPISVMTRAETVKDGKEPERVTLQVFERISTAQSQAKQVSCNAQLALHPLLDASLHQVTGYCHLAASHPFTAASSEADR